jgi:hypothetical protein
LLLYTRWHSLTLMRVFMPLRGRATGRNWDAACGILTPRQWAV